MRWLLLITMVMLVAIASSFAQNTNQNDAARIERGRDAVRGKPAMNAGMWSLTALDDAWKKWGVKEKPAKYDVALRERYGLHEAPYDNGGLPMGFHVAGGLFGKGLVDDCLICHAGSIAGTSVIGLGNASLDLQAIFDEMPGVTGTSMQLPVRMSNVRGTVEATATVTYLMDFRNPDLSLREPGKLKIADDLCDDVPAWWLMKKKKTIYHIGAGDARSVRSMMPFLLSPLNTAEQIKKQEPLFADVQAYLLTLSAPKYPFPIDQTLAAKGEPLFLRNCSKCHGTYGMGSAYPNKVIPLETIGTDSRLLDSQSADLLAHYRKSWFGEEKGPDGKPFPVQPIRGYQAPPLDGVWATAPYFHNGSAPTIYHVLNSKARPKVFTRSYRTEKADYDVEKLGWKITALDRSPVGKLPPIERRKIYDTAEPGRGNGGHTFGDALTEEERRAVIEYLKTL